MYCNRPPDDQNSETFGCLDAEYANNFINLINALPQRAGPMNTFQPLTKGIYYNQIKHWLKYFPKNNMIFINGDQLLSNPGKILTKLQKDLGLSSFFKEF